jgi:hypothetical protein
MDNKLLARDDRIDCTQKLTLARRRLLGELMPRLVMQQTIKQPTNGPCLPSCAASAKASYNHGGVQRIRSSGKSDSARIAAHLNMRLLMSLSADRFGFTFTIKYVLIELSL